MTPDPGLSRPVGSPGGRPVRHEWIGSSAASPTADGPVRSHVRRPTQTGQRSERKYMNRRIKVIGALAIVALAASACGGGGTTNNATSKTLVVGVDLPFQGSAKDASDDTWNAMSLYLDQVGGKAGN